MTRCVGLVLAGGASRRMGSDKTALRLNQRSLLSISRETLEAVCGKVYIAGSRHTDVVESTPFQGPAAGIVNAVEALSLARDYEYLVVSPVDMPELSSQNVQSLLAQAHKLQSSTYFNRCYLPCVIHLPSLNNLVNQTNSEFWSNMPMRKLLGWLRGVSIAHNAPHQLSNVNTPDQWRACVARAKKSPRYEGLMN